MLTVRTSENTVITSFRLISERQDFSSVRTGENTVRARARIQPGLVRTSPKILRNWQIQSFQRPMKVMRSFYRSDWPLPKV